MNNNVLAFTLTILAGLSTMIGTILIFIKKKDHNSLIGASLSFAAGVMICTSITDLIPESIILLKNNFSNYVTIIICFLGLILGIVVSMIIDYYVPDTTNYQNKSLFRVGLISMIAIIIHNIPEGIATFVATSSNTRLGVSLAIAIAMHNIPEGISISVPLYYSTKSKKKALIYTLVSALSEPLGALLAYIFLKNIINNITLGILFSLIAGIMLEISFKTLLPNSKKYQNPKLIIYFILGILFMLIKLLF